MIKVLIDSIRVSLMSQLRVVILKDPLSGRYLPIFIGPCEAEAIAVKLQGMSVVYCAFGGEGGAGFLGLLVSDHVYRFNGQACQIVYVPTSPLPMSGLVVFAAAHVGERPGTESIDDLTQFLRDFIDRLIP